MKKIIIYSILAILSISIVAILFSNKQKAEERVFKYDESKKVAVTVSKVIKEKLLFEKTYSGTFEPNRESKLMFELPGKIQIMNYEIGDYVSKGTVISQLDHELLKLQKEQYEIQLESLEKDLKRNKILLDEKALNLVQYEKTETAFKSAQVQLKTINEQINKSFLKAPFNGIIANKFSEIGTVTAPQLPVVLLSEVDKLRMTIQVPQNDIIFFEINEVVKIKNDLSSSDFILGRVLVISGKSDITHNYLIQIEVDNHKNEKRAGQFGYVIKEIGSISENLIIPNSSIIGSAVMPQVYTVEDNKAIIKNIEILYKNEQFTAIKSGLAYGDNVITSGFINLTNGKNILVLNSNPVK